MPLLLVGTGYVCFTACMSVYYVYATVPWRPKEGVGSPGTGMTDGHEPVLGIVGSALPPPPLGE